MREANKCVVEVSIDRTQWKTIGPDFLHLGHRHFEKEVPEAINKGAFASSSVPAFYRLPIDLIRMVVPPTEGQIVDAIEEVLVIYDKKK